MEYTLNVGIDKKDLEIASDAGLKVVILKQTKDGSANVVWVSFDPFPHNTVKWTEQYSIYASDTELINGATINSLCDKEALPQFKYTFTNSGLFDPGKVDPKLEPNQYEIVNKYTREPALTFGLAQDVQVGSKAKVNGPICAVKGPSHFTQTFQPIENISIFLQSLIETKTIMTNVKSEALSVAFKDNNVHTVKYSGDAGQFVLVS